MDDKFSEVAFNNSDDFEEKSYDELMEHCRNVTKLRISEIVALNMPMLHTAEGKVLFEEQLYGLFL